MIQTARLILREWQPPDRETFARLNADPRVMEFFPNVLTRAQSDRSAEAIEQHFRTYGFGLYALESREDGRFIGFTGLAVPAFDAHFTPSVEIGWRLAASHWGRGLATEAAQAAARYAFGPLKLGELVAYTVPANARSRRVMDKLGMTHDPADDFDHPRIAVGHPLRRHVLYRLSAAKMLLIA